MSILLSPGNVWPYKSTVHLYRRLRAVHTRVCMCIYIYIYTRVCVRAHALVSRMCVCVCTCVCMRACGVLFHSIATWCTSISWRGLLVLVYLFVPWTIAYFDFVTCQEKKKKKKKFSGKKGIGSKFPFREITNHARLYWRRWTIKIWTIPIEDKKQDVACKKKKENRFLPVRRIIFVMERGTVSWRIE